MSFSVFPAGPRSGELNNLANCYTPLSGMI